MLEKLLAMTGADLPAAVKSATDGIASLNQHMARNADNTEAIGARLALIDDRLNQVQLMQAEGQRDIAAAMTLLSNGFHQKFAEASDNERATLDG